MPKKTQKPAFKRILLKLSVESLIGNLPYGIDFNTTKSIAEEIKHIEYAYVIYDAHRRTHIDGVLDGLSELGIHSIGRYGAWEYSFMERSLLAGKGLAGTIMK